MKMQDLIQNLRDKFRDYLQQRQKKAAAKFLQAVK